jgi:hypothetical protein
VAADGPVGAVGGGGVEGGAVVGAEPGAEFEAVEGGAVWGEAVVVVVGEGVVEGDAGAAAVAGAEGVVRAASGHVGAL